MADAATLLEWRNDPLTRENSHNTAEVSLAEHTAWLAAALANPTRALFIAEESGPVGTARADYSDSGCELSWTVAPQARGKGVASRMVCLLASQIPGALFAEVKRENAASARVAEKAGFTLVEERAGVLYFSRARS